MWEGDLIDLAFSCSSQDKWLTDYGHRIHPAISKPAIHILWWLKDDLKHVDGMRVCNNSNMVELKSKNIKISSYVIDLVYLGKYANKGQSITFSILLSYW